MWRSFFLAVGICLCLVGAECLVVERVQWQSSAPRDPQPRRVSVLGSPAPAGSRSWTPSESTPWTLLSAGAVVILYSFTLPRRVAS